MVINAYIHLNEIERERINRQSYSLALLGADLVAIAAGGESIIEPNRYLPFGKKNTEEVRVPISPATAKLILEAISNGVIHPKFLGVLAGELKEIEAISNQN
jgi:hypothetical protein